MIIDLNYY